MQLLPILDNYLASLPTQSADRAARCYHPSEISITPCVRRLVYSRVEAPRTGVVGPELRRVFDNGHGVHARIQGYFREVGIRWGAWRCTKCQFEWEDLQVVPQVCPSCFWTWGNQIKYQIEYREVPIQHPKWPIRGHADGLIQVESALEAIEIKSIRSREFDRLEVPKTEHLVQFSIYLSCLLDKDVRSGIFIYENKDDQRIKEFQVNYDPKMAEIGLAKVAEAEDHYQRLELPCRYCGHPDDYEARRCPFSEVCFGDKPLELLM